MKKFSKGGDINNTNNAENSKILLIFSFILPIVLYYLAHKNNIFNTDTYNMYSFVFITTFALLMGFTLSAGDNKKYFGIYVGLVIIIYLLIYLWLTYKPWKWSWSIKELLKWIFNKVFPTFIIDQVFQSSIPIFLDFEYLHNQKNVANNSNIPQLEYIDPVTNIVSYNFNKNYSISMWIYLNQQTHSFDGNRKNINIFSYGNLDDMKPGISYNNNYKKTDNKDIYTITFTGPAYNKQNFYDVELTSQKWNNFVFNYSHNSVDLFINGDLERTFMFDNNFPNYDPTDLFTIGDNNGLNGAIGNILYYNKPLTSFQIADTYNLLMDKNPPRNNIL